MSKFDREYYFIRKDDSNERLPFLSPAVGMYERQYSSQVPQPGSAPYVFSNGWKEEYAELGIQEDTADILFDASTFIVRDHIREQLLELALPHLHLHPAVYVDDQDRRHEDYWYVYVAHHLDCWDRETSTYGRGGIKFDDQRLYSVERYALDTDLLDATPLRDRLVFRMGSTLDSFVTCHASVAQIFRGSGSTGASLQVVTEY